MQVLRRFIPIGNHQIEIAIGQQADVIDFSPKAVLAPEFVKSDDPWFRPVQIKLGPDGAVWVADFYNKIIGHYEVDLNHPGRDRTSGRIWRIVYKGDAAKAPPPNLPDMGKMPLDGQIGLLGVR